MRTTAEKTSYELLLEKRVRLVEEECKKSQNALAQLEIEYTFLQKSSTALAIDRLTKMVETKVDLLIAILP